MTSLKRAIIVAWILFEAAANAREPPLPIPPIPPAEPPLPSAPIPNLGLIGEYDVERHSMVTLDSDINHRSAPATGFGYAPGASYKIDSDRRFFVLPGILVHVPLP
jgi:hypothetical protein